MTILNHQIPGTYGLSISDDDDVCSTCQFLVYNPGELSYCKKDWPCESDRDSQIRDCPEYSANEEITEND